jgi:23S rRNA pseudouridine2605 synthase
MEKRMFNIHFTHLLLMKKTSNYHSKKDVQSGSKFSKDSTKKSFDKKRKSSDFESSENSSKEHKKTFTKSEKPAYKKYSKDSSEDKSKKPYSSKTSDFKKTDKKFVAKGEKPTYNKYKQEDSEDKSKKPYNSRTSDFKKNDKKFVAKGEKPTYNKYKQEDSEDKSKKPYNSRTSDFKKTDKKFTFKKEEKPFYKKTRGEDSGYKTSYKKNSDDKSDAKEDKKSFKKSSGFKSKNERSSFKDKNTPTYNLKFYEDKYKKEVKEEKTENGDIRLNKFIANAGVCSRREADDLITQGFVKVNGKTITEMGYQVKPSDKVSYKGKLLQREKLVYILLNKPKNCITTTDDPEERHTVMEIVKDACEERVYPVGRLDRNTTGLLLLTNDGDLAKRLAHPSNNIRKIYQVGLDKPISETDYLKIQEGLELEDGFIKPDALALLTPDTLGIELHSGRNRIVRRIFEHLGYSVEKLDRTMYAGLTKKDLPRGKWRFLNQKEVVLLKFSKIRKSPVKKISQK